MSGEDADGNAGDRSYLVLAKPNVIMNDTRLGGLVVSSSDATARKNPHNHAQTARNPRLGKPRTFPGTPTGSRWMADSK